MPRRLALVFIVVAAALGFGPVTARTPARASTCPTQFGSGSARAGVSGPGENGYANACLSTPVGFVGYGLAPHNSSDLGGGGYRCTSENSCTGNYSLAFVYIEDPNSNRVATGADVNCLTAEVCPFTGFFASVPKDLISTEPCPNGGDWQDPSPCRRVWIFRGSSFVFWGYLILGDCAPALPCTPPWGAENPLESYCWNPRAKTELNNACYG